ncbi:MAG: hypothetical protein WD225_01320 [Ilumatobacteraceae bacterium]
MMARRALRRLLSVPVAGWHLAARFVTSLPAHPPSVVDEVWAEDHLLPVERRLWRRLANPDRRHSIVVARRFVVARPGASRAEIAGALLHDVGKVECRLGTLARVVATLVGPRTERFRAYHEHEAIGARLLAEAGADVVTVRLVAGDGPAVETLRSADHA